MTSITELLTEPKPELVTMTAAEYHADPCPAPSLASSIGKTLINVSPAHARLEHPRLNPDFASKEEARFDLGSVAHELLLEGETSVSVVEADDWRTKAAQEQRDEARANGRIPLLAKDWDRVEAMRRAALRQLEWFSIDPAPLTGGRPEQTLIWNDNGVWCRARYDWLHDNHSAIDDLKTTAASADPAKWSKTMFNIGADFQAAFYLRGMQKAFGVTPVWRFIVQENYPPYALSIVTLSPEVLANASRRVDDAIRLFGKCLADNHWPGYSRQVSEIPLPSWMLTGAA